MTMSELVAKATQRVITVSVDRDPLEPEIFLRAHSGLARGFWSHAGHWTAFAGAVAALESPGGARRFADVRAQAELVAREAADDVDPPARFHGGFAFSPATPRDAFWTAFASARFVMPAFELTGGAGAAESRAYARVRCNEGDAKRARAHARALLADVSTVWSAAAPTHVAARAVTVGSTDREAWDRAVTAALGMIERERLEKVVLARTLDVSASPDLDPVDVLERVRRDNPRATVFYFEPQPGHVFLGAAPEVVVVLHGNSFHATAVAGSVGRGSTPAQDERLAQDLLGSPKERREHAIGVDDLIRRVAPLAREVEADPEPHVLRLARIQHLETQIRATVADDQHVLDLLGALHPSAAVCGQPRDAAFAFLGDREPFERGWYAGPVGWFDTAGNGAFAPALRSAVGLAGRWRLFAGAGIVPGSDPAREWEETRIKFQPMLNALGAQNGG